MLPLAVWEQRLFLTLWPLLFKSHGKWITRSGFNSQIQEGGIYPFCFIFCGFWFNSMLWVALTAWSWWSCSSYKYPFLNVLTVLIKLVHLFLVYVLLIPWDYGFSTHPSIHPSVHLLRTQQAFEWQPGARCCARCCWPEDVWVTQSFPSGTWSRCSYPRKTSPRGNATQGLEECLWRGQSGPQMGVEWPGVCLGRGCRRWPGAFTRSPLRRWPLYLVCFHPRIPVNFVIYRNQWEQYGLSVWAPCFWSQIIILSL